MFEVAMSSDDSEGPLIRIRAEDYDTLVAEAAVSWESLILKRANGICDSCGNSDHKLKANMLVPEAAGGQRIASNGAAICRTCELASDRHRREATPASGDTTRPVNFWISQQLYQRIQEGLNEKYGFRSVASLVRYLISKYVVDAARFDDVAQYQDSGSDVKVNVWVPKNLYETFKLLVDAQGLTVTDTLKGLIRMYEMEIDRVVSSRTEGSNVH